MMLWLSETQDSNFRLNFEHAAVVITNLVRDSLVSSLVSAVISIHRYLAPLLDVHRLLRVTLGPVNYLELVRDVVNIRGAHQRG